MTTFLHQLRLGVRRSPSLHAAFDVLGVLAAGKTLYEQLILRRTYIDIIVMGRALRIAICSKREIERIETFSEQPFVEQILQSLRPGDVIWDVGANIGVISLLLAGKAREIGATIHAFEPEPRNYRQLVRNVKLNGLDREISPWQLALSDVEGPVDLFVEGEAGEGGHSMLVSRAGSRCRVTVDCQTAWGLSRRSGSIPDVVKIDVEGAEMRVLRGMSELLAARRIRDLFIEVHPTQLLADGSSDSELSRWLAGHGYEAIQAFARGFEFHQHYRSA